MPNSINVDWLSLDDLTFIALIWSRAFVKLVTLVSVHLYLWVFIRIWFSIKWVIFQANLGVEFGAVDDCLLDFWEDEKL